MQMKARGLVALVTHEHGVRGKGHRKIPLP